VLEEKSNKISESTCENVDMTTRMMQEFAERFQRLCIEKWGRVNKVHIGKALGVSATTIHNYLNGDAWPREKRMEEIAHFFNVTVDYLRTGKNNDTQKPAKYPKSGLDTHILAEALRCVDEAVDFFPNATHQQQALMLTAAYKYLLNKKAGKPMSWEAAKAMVAALGDQMTDEHLDNTPDM